MEDDDGLNTDDLTCCLADFLVAGTETTANTLKWMVLYLTLHQEVQDRCRQEIREVIGDSRSRVEDIQRLPYTQVSSKIYEEYRKYSPGDSVRGSETLLHRSPGDCSQN